jgi:uncharacterized damage-inducible protein DinB
MAHQLTTSYLKDSLELFHYYKRLAERAIEQCSDAQLTATIDGESNSIAILVKHIVGNMRSRWTDFLTTDGEKPDRSRDTEFEAPPSTRAELLQQWASGWQILFDALGGLTEADMTATVTIRTEPHSVMQAINRQVAHYSYHIGQIVFLGKHHAAAAGKWTTLTIPRGQSEAFRAKVAAGQASQR